MKHYGAKKSHASLASGHCSRRVHLDTIVREALVSISIFVDLLIAISTRYNFDLEDDVIEYKL